MLDYTCGSLGQGLSAAAGYALSARMRAEDTRTFAMVSDGELEEGQVWEAAMFAAHLRVVGPDRAARREQLPGRRARRLDHHLEPMADKWAAFGWHAQDVDGHDVDAVLAALAETVQAPGPAS